MKLFPDKNFYFFKLRESEEEMESEWKQME